MHYVGAPPVLCRRYTRLGNLPAVTTLPRFTNATAGMAHDFQFIDVPDFMGRGESTPLAHFYQNLGEAEYAVALYQYLRLTGHPASSIALLTTYNGQKRLLGDVVRRRCAPYGCFGTPAAIDTVDMFQGQQADIIILSLVRTKAVGHLRDVRRLIVAVSRARRAVYVFGRAQVCALPCEIVPAPSCIFSNSLLFRCICCLLLLCPDFRKLSRIATRPKPNDRAGCWKTHAAATCRGRVAPHFSPCW